MNKKAYFVYESYGPEPGEIRAVFTEEQAAKDYAEEFGYRYNWTALNPEYEKLPDGKSIYQVDVYKTDAYEPRVYEWRDHSARMLLSSGLRLVGDVPNKFLTGYVLADSKEHAREIGKKKRQELIEAGEWPDE